MKLLIAGDSLSMSRHADGISFEQIYAVRIQRAHPAMLVINGSERANSSRRIASEEYLDEYLRPLAPDHVVIQVGVVDCTPRIFTEGERRLLRLMQRVPLLRAISRAIIRAASRNRAAITRQRNMPMIPLDEFQRHLQAFILEARKARIDCSIAIVNIACPSATFLLRNHGALELVERYNAALQTIASEAGSQVIDLFAYTRQHPESLLADGYHINAKAHQFLYEALATHLISAEPNLRSTA
ncbi:SGNH/GDSL hydrolase family protein [Pelomonas sp. P7]|uniref:SGNH/GDSL hydrolase family protein n=1 Tax=Pelomonas caseinilytica TaxID=2906763 RepID=A0ABS8XLR0_9BURK|nr:SGNH/GDSL hydrolase family protein [Pelomonas sp. P7]MCE4538170.1 SGNH/GDSL hydrolase family protein [Pelomonas sp. P7]